MQESIGSLILKEERFMRVTLRNIIDAYSKPYGLKLIHMYVLGLLSHKGGQTTNQLCDTARMKPSNMSPLCHDLEKKGYIRRERDEHDRRSVQLFLTPEGSELLEGLDDWLNRVLSGAGEENEELHADIRKGFTAFRKLVELASNE